MPLLYEGADWNFDTLKRIYDACEEIAVGELGLDVYPNQIEVVTSEQMLDVYSSHGLPISYRHHSFGKRFVQHETLYRKGYQGLAYEIVINSSPCISYIMEENTATMQTLVIAHATFGHNHVFKNNCNFKQWTDADGILDYLEFAKAYVAECEEKHGVAAVERILDAAHALQSQGVDRYTRRVKRQKEEEKRAAERHRYAESTFDPIWSTLPGNKATMSKAEQDETAAVIKAKMNLPEENILYFIEKHAPKLKPWQREVIRIVRKISQYFYPQPMTKVLNEGAATFTHMEIMQRLNDRGQISDGHFLEFLKSHSGVIMQLPATSEHYSGWNPYALGFAIMNDIKRICLEPTAEDRRWFPDFAGNGDPYGKLREVWADYRDDSLIHNFLSPKVIRDFGMFDIADRRSETARIVEDIHDEAGYRRIRSKLAHNYDMSRLTPDLNITDVDLLGDRRLVINHAVLDGHRLDEKSARAVLSHVADLWGYPVRLIERDASDDKELGTFDALPEEDIVF